MAVMPRPFAAPAMPQAPQAPLRRCTFRRIEMVSDARALPMYEVACTFPDRRKAVSLGDIDSARPVCESCTYQGIFRPDSD
jgi:hypothetical protein